MKEYRCKKCHKLLMIIRRGVEFLEKYEEIKTSPINDNTQISEVEIKCSKCKIINTFSISKEVFVH